MWPPVILNSLFLKWQYYLLGDEKYASYHIVNSVSIVKNLVLFPLEAVLIAVFVYILSSLSYTMLDTPFTAETESQVFLLRTTTYFGGGAILYAFHLHLCDLYSR